MVQQVYVGKNSGFTVDVGLLGCVDLTTFRRNILPSYSALKMEAI
jgi:hypothetical protein